MNAPAPDDRGGELFVRLLFGVLGWSFSLFGLLSVVTEARFALGHVTTTAIVVDDGSGTVEFTLPDGRPQVSDLLIAPRHLVRGQHVRIDYLDREPSVARTAGNHGDLIFGVGSLVLSAVMLWRLLTPKALQEDPSRDPQRGIFRELT